MSLIRLKIYLRRGQLRRRDAHVVSRGAWGADAGAGRRVGGGRARRQRARVRADRQRQDAGGVPADHKSNPGATCRRAAMLVTNTNKNVIHFI